MTSPSPLPPPTVPTTNSSNPIPPPPLNNWPSHIIQDATAPPLSALPSTTTVDSPNLNHHQITDTANSDHPSDPVDSDDSSSRINQKKIQQNHSNSTCLSWHPFQSHQIDEASTSAWFDIRILLVFRLIVTATLLGHLVFFSLRNDFSYKRYETWNYVGLTLSFLLALMCSLIYLIRDEDAYVQFNESQGEGMITDVERQPVGQPYLPDPKLLRILTRLTVPLYQIFVSTTLFGAALYWSVLFDSNSVSISYPLLMLLAAAPAVALLDFILSMSMSFRLIYISLYVLYNVIYFAFFWTWFKLKNDVIYNYLDPDQSSFAGRIGAIVGGCVLAGFLIYLVSLVKYISCIKSRQDDTDDDIKLNNLRDSTKDSELSKRMSSEISGNSNDKVSDENLPVPDKRVIADRAEEIDPDFCLNRAGVDELDIPSTPEHNDRNSASITPMNSFGNSNSSRWLRSLSGRIPTTLSNLSESDEERRFSRNDSRSSGWEELNPTPAKIQDEYFTMPGAYTITGEKEAIKLEAIPRTGSSNGIDGIIHRSNSNQFSRSSSRNGTRLVFNRSFSNRSMNHVSAHASPHKVEDNNNNQFSKRTPVVS